MNPFNEFFLNESKSSKNKFNVLYDEFLKNNPVEIVNEYSDTSIYSSSTGKFNIAAKIFEHDTLEYIIHEMGHVAEIQDPERLLQQSFGFKGSFKIIPAIHTELRVFAYEHAIYKHIKGRSPLSTLLSNIHSIKEYAVDGDEYSIFQINKIIKKEFPKYKKIYNIDKFQIEWNKKMEFLKEFE